MQGITVTPDITLPFEETRLLKQYIQGVDILLQDYKLQFLAHNISELILEDANEALSNAVPNNMLNDHGIIGSPIYDEDINCIETGLSEHPILVQCLDIHLNDL